MDSLILVSNKNTDGKPCRLVFWRIGISSLLVLLLHNPGYFLAPWKHGIKEHARIHRFLHSDKSWILAHCQSPASLCLCYYSRQNNYSISQNSFKTIVFKIGLGEKIMKQLFSPITRKCFLQVELPLGVHRQLCGENSEAERELLPQTYPKSWLSGQLALSFNFSSCCSLSL